MKEWLKGRGLLFDGTDGAAVGAWGLFVVVVVEPVASSVCSRVKTALTLFSLLSSPVTSIIIRGNEDCALIPPEITPQRAMNSSVTLFII